MQELRYRPKGNHRKLWVEPRPRRLLLSGPAGTGKTRAILELVHYYAQTYPGSRHLILRRYRTQCTESVLATFETFVVPGYSWVRNQGRLNRHSYVLPNGSEIIIGGLDKPEGFRSMEFDTVYIGEATQISADQFWEVDARLRWPVMPFKQALMDCNPDSPNHWLYNACQRGDITMIPTTHADNPAVTADYLESLRALPGIKRKRLYEGLWVSAEGSIYPEFGPDCIIEPFQVPDSWPRVVGVDFGYNNPTAAQWWAISPDDVAYLYREIYHTGLAPAQLGEMLMKYSQGEPVYKYFTDHDATDRATLKMMGITTMRADKAVLSGIEACARRMLPNDQGKRRLYLMRGALVRTDPALVLTGQPTCLADELPSYRWADPVQTTGLVRDQPHKHNDHACDAMRYALYSWQKTAAYRA